MFSFAKSNKEYDVLKLFKVVDLETAKQFQTKECINVLLSFLNKHYNMHPNVFDLNYGNKVWNSFKKFEESIVKISDESIVSLSGYYTLSKSRFSFTNNILNLKGVALSYINITLVIDKSFLNSDIIINLVKKMNNISEFDYGYGFRISDDYDFDTEKKYKKSLFGNSISICITDEDINSEKRKIDFKDGYIKKIYSLNFLNALQLKSSKIKDNVEKKIGVLSELNDKLFQWSLNDDDLDEIR
jgi:hypothetical protein